MGCVEWMFSSKASVAKGNYTRQKCPAHNLLCTLHCVILHGSVLVQGWMNPRKAEDRLLLAVRQVDKHHPGWHLLCCSLYSSTHLFWISSTQSSITRTRIWPPKHSSSKNMVPHHVQVVDQTWPAVHQHVWEGSRCWFKPKVDTKKLEQLSETDSISVSIFSPCINSLRPLLSSLSPTSNCPNNSSQPTTSSKKTKNLPSPKLDFCVSVPKQTQHPLSPR